MYRAYRDPHAYARNFFSPNVHAHAFADSDPHTRTATGGHAYAHAYPISDANADAHPYARALQSHFLEAGVAYRVAWIP